MIRAAIYSAGPSLTESWRGGYDVGIAINRAAFVVPQLYWQWLSAGDLLARPEIFADYPIPASGYFAMRDNMFTQYPKTHNDRHLLIWDALPPLPGDTRFSITASLHLAAYLGAGEITVYGHDQQVIRPTGDPYIDPFAYGENRKQIEGQEVDKAVALLGTIGVHVTFIAQIHQESP
ncbi:MAG: hypothetical protein KGN77_05260 [Xanthomonadaceae bacterium]|nr:hypothetical protein [Xanthomonadaceae bacterium]